MEKNYYRWAIGFVIRNGNVSGVARLQAEAALRYVETEEGLKVLLFALGYTERGVEQVLVMVKDKKHADEGAEARL